MSGAQGGFRLIGALIITYTIGGGGGGFLIMPPNHGAFIGFCVV